MTLEVKRFGGNNNIVLDDSKPPNLARNVFTSHKIFRNPDIPEGSTLQQVFESNGAVKPRDWHLAPWELDTVKPENNGFQNEDLIVWMRAAALPNFR